MKYVVPILLLWSAPLWAAEPAKRVYTQLPEMAPTQTSEPPAQAENAFVASNLVKRANASWIWGPDNNRTYVARRTFEGGTKAARLLTTCDNVVRVSINGKLVASSSTWQDPIVLDVQKFIKPGENELVAEISNQGAVAAFILVLALTDADGQERFLATDKSWQLADKAAPAKLFAARDIARYGSGPWADVFANTASAAPAGFAVPEGFQVELLFTVPKDELGSWVCLALDDRGRLLVSDQGNEGLCRVTPSPIGSGQPTKIERLDVKMTGAHGMLHAHGSLYVSANGGPGSGLYRLRDTNNDDQYDEVDKLKEIEGGGEHGPHSLRLGPDGKSIYLICGNHTKPPFDVERSAPPQTMGGLRAEQLHARLPAGAASRLAPNWDEDLVLPRQWDANGHAAGILAPGGWVAKTDPEGKNWEIVSSGYRNPFDFAFNADGEMFVYDADMEWDFGVPWYRPTRVSHSPSGSEFGWRSGTGKWPPYFVDSLPAIVDIGPGSPVGVTFGYGAKFPAKYQKALFILDWTFGTIHAIHLEPAGASYKATNEDFLSRTPLPLTDAVVGRDGALYFIVGGRGTQSELFRVTYAGKESTTPVEAQDKAGRELRALRRQIEAYHRLGADPAQAVPFLVPQLGHADRYIRYAARVALERLPVADWQEQVLALREPDALITGIVGLARQADPPLKPKLLAALEKLDFGQLDKFQQVSLLRAYELVLIRLGLPSDDTRGSLGAKLDSLFPSNNEPVSRELANLMVALESPAAAQKLVPVLERERVVGEKIMGAEVLDRNRGYGAAVASVLANQPDAFQMHVAFALRNLKTGWTPELRKAYFGWFEKAHGWAGGNSYQKFLTNIDADAFGLLNDSERLMIEAAGAHKPYKAPELPKPKGPGRDYTLDDLLGWSKSDMHQRNFKNGQKTFAAARCVVCHRFGGDGGSTGPDLTQVAGRFNFKDLSESIVDPSKVVSDQYRTTIVQTAEGKSYTGRVVSVGDDSITLLVDPEDSTKLVTIKKSDIEAQELSPVSLMPKDLLKPLNRNEVLDLLAYLLSRGNPRDPMFEK